MAIGLLPGELYQGVGGRDAAPDDDGRSANDLSLDLAVPVLVRGLPGLQRGLVRNISDRGALVELSEAPPIGSEVEITLSGVHGSLDAPESLTLTGYVQHHLAWQHRRGALRAVRVRFATTSAY